MAQRTRRYLIRRVTVVLLTLFVVTLLSFLLMRLSPVDPATAYVKRNSAVVTQEQIDEARVILGLDKPLPVQYFDWVVDALHMDFGISLGTGNPVWVWTSHCRCSISIGWWTRSTWTSGFLWEREIR